MEWPGDILKYSAVVTSKMYVIFVVIFVRRRGGCVVLSVVGVSFGSGSGIFVLWFGG